MKRLRLVLLSACAALAGCATMTTMPVAGPPEAYYFIAESKIRNLSEAEFRRRVLRRHRYGINDLAPVSSGVAYRFVPECRGVPIWAPPQSAVARPGARVALRC